MADVKIILRDLIINDAQAAALVGTKVYAVIIPQNVAFPAISIETVNTEPTEVKGFLNIADIVSVQINIFTTNASGVNGYDKGVAIAKAIRTALDFEHGFTNSDTDIDEIRLVGEEDGPYNKEVEVYHRILRYEVDINNDYIL